jgi:neurofibromin 1
MLLGIMAKPLRRDKFEVTPDSVAYLTALVCVSEEVRLRCHVKHTLPRWPNEVNINDSIVDTLSQNGQNVRRQKSWDLLDQSAIAYARQHKTPPQVRLFSVFFFLPIDVWSMHFFPF